MARSSICQLAFALAIVIGSGASFSNATDSPATLPGTAPLTAAGDIAAQLVAGADRFLLRKIEESAKRRDQYWQRDFSSPEAYEKSIAPNRRRLAEMLGVRDPRVAFDAPELLATTAQSALVGAGEGYEIYAVRWPVLEDPDPLRATPTVFGEGLLLVPAGGKKPVADILALPDADQTPEQIAGLAEGVPAASQFARTLAEIGCRVLVPALIDRQLQPRNGRAKLTSREYLYRPGFVLGRHLIGYEVQKALAAVDWFAREAEAQGRDPRLGVIGYGEGGMLATFAAALDPRIDAAAISGYGGELSEVWRQPPDRNVFGILAEFDGPELAGLIAPRPVIFDSAPGPKVTLPSEGGAPGALTGESAQAGPRHQAWNKPAEERLGFRQLNVTSPGDKGDAAFCSRRVTDALLAALKVSPQTVSSALQRVIYLPDAAARHQRQMNESERHNQLLLDESPYARKARFWDQLDYSSPAAYEKSIAPFRDEFREEVIGRFDEPVLPPRPRTRLWRETNRWTAYEVMLDVWPEVFAYGILIVPKDLPLHGSQRRPVVVCQHGLEGRPEDVIAGDHRAYHDFAAKLAERGLITFAPQNLYIGRDNFRTLQRKANPLGKTLFSIIVPQHQQIVDWLQSLPYVDGRRIAFYGLSYGGKTAMRVPALVEDYCLSICSADFNEWVGKNASTRSPFSYVWTGEYEIFEWDLAHTFNYAEMAALVAPRPFMVERGHFDGVGSDEAVAGEFAKVRHLYAARLKIPERTRIEFFPGPHTIHGQGTFEFLHEHLAWPRPAGGE